MRRIFAFLALLSGLMATGASAEAMPTGSTSEHSVSASLSVAVAAAAYVADAISRLPTADTGMRHSVSVNRYDAVAVPTIRVGVDRALQ